MAVDVLHPQDCLKRSFSQVKHPRNLSAYPKKSMSNRTRRNHPRNRTVKSSPVTPSLTPPRSAVYSGVPKRTMKKNPYNSEIVGQVRILKRGEELPELPKLPKKTADLVVEKSDLESTPRIRPDPGLSSSQIRSSGRTPKTIPFYAGCLSITSPPPTDVPLPAFSTAEKSVSGFQSTAATNDLIKILRLDIDRLLHL